MKKKTLAIALALLICVCAVVGGTQAYLSGKAEAHNVITVGDVEIRLWELDENNAPYDTDQKAMPGSVITKKAYVENLEQDSYIRARYTLEVEDASGKKLDLSESELEKLILVSGTDSRWKDYGDGWLYYSEVLNNSTKKTTGLLMETVTLSGPNITSEYANCKFKVIVQAQAVQAKNNAPAVAGDLSTLSGWPVA